MGHRTVQVDWWDALAHGLPFEYPSSISWCCCQYYCLHWLIHQILMKMYTGIRKYWLFMYLFSFKYNVHVRNLILVRVLNQYVNIRFNNLLTNLSYWCESLLLLSCNFSLYGVEKTLTTQTLKCGDKLNSCWHTYFLTLRRGISLACCTSKWSSLTCCLTSGGTGLQQATMPWGSLRRDKENTVQDVLSKKLVNLTCTEVYKKFETKFNLLTWGAPQISWSSYE